MKLLEKVGEILQDIKIGNDFWIRSQKHSPWKQKLDKHNSIKLKSSVQQRK
jgi:hypothetical protein